MSLIKIRQYAKNRRLYDYTNHCYIKKQDVINYIHNGDEVVITNGNQDVTVRFLALIIADDHLNYKKDDLSSLIVKNKPTNSFSSFVLNSSLSAHRE